MTNRPKQQGTAWETALCRVLNAIPGVDAERLAEAGCNDLGDIRILTPALPPIVVEAKARERLSLHEALSAARRKAHPHDAVIAWRRLVRRQPDHVRRQTAGDGPIIAMSLALFCELLAAASGVEEVLA